MNYIENELKKAKVFILEVLEKIKKDILVKIENSRENYLIFQLQEIEKQIKKYEA